ncbi:MAG: hypothetical protein ACR2KX_16130 [Chitinophagaceae bacterium]
MADRSDEEPLDSPVNTPSENPSEEIIPARDTGTIPNQEIKNMEVHHHAHHEGKKNWKSYFWEFLMLFLAVFCGFLAEYQLEHKIEKDRAKEYASLLMEDLKNDSVYINQLLFQENFKIKQADSLLFLLTSDTSLNNNYKLVYHLNHVGTMIDFKPAFPVNFEQMKNSGSLRYIRNKKLISQLSALNREMETTAEVYIGHNQFLREQLAPFSIQHLNTMQYDIFSRKVLVPEPDIFDWDKKVARLLANKVNLVKTFDLFFLNRFLKNCKENQRN